ncbi:hypothetical protein [Crocosphaera chwakensis]|uniref:Signal transduction histidine kinase LytS n=1 Tax=Crocosphaera chwakensis CCY0110 TaxID=391612 RepID=A3IW27_9CHRO|nr:hypothetical protein [Crocosphaera chwakensis]EAZ89338.1 hypothetical protein CY0110_20550 [Crocosphaera chwakensis CCY0110]
MNFSEYSALGLGVFSSYIDAAKALEQLQHEGFSKDQLSFIAKLSDNYDHLTAPLSGDRYVTSLPSASNPIEDSGLTRLMNSVSPVSSYSVPRIGYVMAGGRLSELFYDSSRSETQEPLLEFLSSLTIPELSARLYKDRIRQGDCLILVGASKNHLTAAENVLAHYQVQDWKMVTVNQPDTTHASSQRQAIGVFKNYNDVDLAIRELQRSAFPMEQVSVITRNRDDVTLGARRSPVDETLVDKKLPDTYVSNGEPHYQTGKGAQTGTLAGGSLGGLAGLLVGLGTLAIPGVGPILLAGTAATAIATTVAGGIMGATAGGLIGALVGLGIPEGRAKVYQKHLSKDHYLVMISGTSAEITQSEQILKSHGVEEWEVYDLPTQSNSASCENGLNHSINSSSTIPSTMPPTMPPTNDPVTPTAFPY